MTKQKVVYSTTTGDQRKQSAKPPGRRTSVPPQQHDLRIMRDKKGRKGKVVTIITGFALTDADLKDLAKLLKGLCGAGGTVKSESAGQVLEIQGDHRDKIAEKLKSLGYKAKPAGG